MPKRTVYHVVHDSRADGWRVDKEGSSRAVATADTKAEAVDVARESARGDDLGQVIVYRMDGSIETEYSYGADPQTTSG